MDIKTKLAELRVVARDLEKLAEIELRSGTIQSTSTEEHDLVIVSLVLSALIQEKIPK